VTRRPILVVLGVLALATLAVALFASRKPGGASSLSSGPHGWSAARRYLEAREGEVPAELRRQSWDAAALPGILAVGFGTQRSFTSAEMTELDRWLRAGGTLVLGYSGRRDDADENRLCHALHVGPLRDLRGGAPLAPRAWRAWVDLEWTVPPLGALAGGREVAVSAQRYAPSVPREASALLREPAGSVIAYETRVGEGRLVVLPADVLSNRRLAHPGNADLLEALRARLGGPWTFDEYHHGLGEPRVGPVSDAAATMDAFLLQLLLLYVAGVLAVVRRFGPAWTDPPLVTGSTAAFLRGVGVRHDRLGHHADAARLLVERARALHPRWRLPGGTAVNGAELVALGRRVARAQGRGGVE
jgi:hypothetical protein